MNSEISAKIEATHKSVVYIENFPQRNSLQSPSRSYHSLNKIHISLHYLAYNLCKPYPSSSRVGRRASNCLICQSGHVSSCDEEGRDMDDCQGGGQYLPNRARRLCESHDASSDSQCSW